MKKIAIFLGLIWFGLGLNAQEKWTLRQCINYAIEHNIDIKQQTLSVQNSEIDLNTSKNSRLPSLDASIGQNFSFGRSRNPMTDMYEDNQSAGTSLSVSASMPLFTGFRISNEIESNKLNLLASVEGLKKAKENLELQVTSLYLEVLFKKEIYYIYQEQKNQTKEQVQKTQLLEESGKIPLAQLYDIKAQLAKDELNETNAQNNLALSTLDLSQALNLADQTSFDIIIPQTEDVISENIGSILPPNQIYEQAITIKPHVKEVEYRLAGSKKNLGIAKAGYLPTLNLGLSHSMGYSYIFGLDDDVKQDGFTKQFKNSSRQYIGFTLGIPIFDRLTTRNRVKTARVNILSRELDLDNIKLSLYKEIQQAYQSAVAAQAKYNATEKAYLAATEAYKYAEERYEVGKLTVFEFNEAKLKLLSSQSEQAQSKYDFLFRAKILDFYRGEQIDIK